MTGRDGGQRRRRLSEMNIARQGRHAVSGKRSRSLGQCGAPGTRPLQEFRGPTLSRPAGKTELQSPTGRPDRGARDPARSDRGADLRPELGQGEARARRHVRRGREQREPGQLLAAAAGGATQSARPRLVKIGTFDQPLYVTAPPGDRRRLFVVEQPGRIRVLVGGKRAAHGRSWTSAGRVLAGGERGLLSMAFAPDYARSGRFYVDFTDSNGNTRVEEFRRSRREPEPRQLGHPQADPVPAAALLRTTTAGCSCSGPTATCTSALGDGGSGGDPENRAQNLDTLLGKILRIDPRRSGRRPHVAAVESVRGRPRRAQRDLRLRPAQSLALLLRPQDRRPLHRRRRPGRRARRSTTRAAERPPGATSAGAASRARAAMTHRAAVPGRPRRCSTTGARTASAR